MTHRSLAIGSTALAIFAAFATVLGGMVLAFDRSLWPIDGCVLYLGQASHLLCFVVSLLATAFALRRSARIGGSRRWGWLSAITFCVAAMTLALTYEAFFVYGFPIG